MTSTFGSCVMYGSGEIVSSGLTPASSLSQRLVHARTMSNTAPTKKRFRIAFSFAGEKRDFVAKVAHILAERFGQDSILYDKYHEPEFSRSDLALHLPSLYYNATDLIVVVLCKDYLIKEWCGLEWNAIYGLLMGGNTDAVMLCRFDRVEGRGLYGRAGYTELDNKTHEEAATSILKRLASNEGRGDQPPAPTLSEQPEALHAWLKQAAAYAKAATRSFRLLPIASLCDVRGLDAPILSGLYVEPAVATYVRQSCDVQTPGDAVDATRSPGGETGTTKRVRIKRYTTRENASTIALLNSADRRHVLLGDAGSGKSSVLRSICLGWAHRFAIERNPEKDGLQAGPAQILVEVGEFLAARNRAAEGRDRAAIETPIDYLTNTCSRAWHFERADLLEALRLGRARLLLDGLDEAFDPDARKRLCNWVMDFAREYPTASIIVSSRSIGFSIEDWWDDEQQSDWEIHTLLPFDDRRVQTFLTNWFNSVNTSPDLGSNLRTELYEAIRRYDFLKALARSPLTLAMLCAVGQRDIRPDSRAKLFEHATHIFIEKWDDLRNLPSDKAEIVREFASFGETGRFEFFRAVADKMLLEGDPNDSNQISHTDLLEILQQRFQKAGKSNPSRLARGILDLICVRNFLLVEQSGDAFAFLHRSFLEYFTALSWAGVWKDDPGLSAKEYFERLFAPHWHDETWHETLRFVVALLEPPQAVACLDLLASLPPVERLDSRSERGLSDEERNVPSEEKALTLAAELASEINPHQQVRRSLAARSLPPRQRLHEITAGWKDRLWLFGFSYCYCEDFSGRALRRRTVSALATIWKDDSSTREALLHGMRRDVSFSLEQDDVGDALLASWTGDAGAKETLLRAATGTPSIPSEESKDVRSRALRILSKGWPCDRQVKATFLRVLTGEPPNVAPELDPTLQTLTVKYLVEGWPGDAEIKNAFLHAASNDASQQLRGLALETLSMVWPGDPEVKDALLRAAVGVPPEVPADIGGEVRSKAVEALVKHWATDADAQAAFVRIVTGAPPNIPPDTSGMVRYRAIDALVQNANGAEEIKSVLLGILIGASPHVSPDANRGVRKKAVSALGAVWAGCPEVKAALLHVFMEDTSSEVREEAVSALVQGWAKDPEVKIALLNATTAVTPESPAEETRVKRYGNMLTGLLDAISPPHSSPDGFSKVRWKVSRALTEHWMGDLKVKEVLLRSAIGAPPDVPPNEHEEVRHQAIWGLSLGWAGDPDVKAAMLHVTVGASPDMKADSSSSVREEAAKALGDGWQGDAEVKDALLRMVIGSGPSGCPEENEEARFEARESLIRGWTGDLTVRTELLRAAVGASPDIPPYQRPNVRRIAFAILAEGWGNDPVVKHASLQALVGLPPNVLPDPNCDVRGTAMRILADHWCRDTDAKSAMLSILQAPPFAGSSSEDLNRLRAGAARALAKGWSGDTEVKTALLRAAFCSPSDPSDSERSVRRQALEGLATGWREDKDAKAALLRAAIGESPDAPPESDWYVRREAMKLLATAWNDYDVKVALLRAAFETPSEVYLTTHNYVRVEAVTLLGQGWAGDPEVMEALLELAICHPAQVPPDPESYVRGEAVKVLTKEWAKDAQLRATMRAVAMDPSAHKEARIAAEHFLSARSA